ncbi:hypothetical protein [Mesorhizobium sp. M0909]|uniref:hypothetical protein n=1 Tax=Mesorhizobium sp. M0909 TaxID=2957024 RepID=UPI003338C8FD
MNRGEVLHACTDIVCGDARDVCLAAANICRQPDRSRKRRGTDRVQPPSGNIGCIYTPKGGTSTYEPQDGGPELSCSRVEPSYVTVVLGPKGQATLIKNPGEQGCCGDVAKLAYGNSWSKGLFSCQSSTKGLTCTDKHGHGFFVSKAKVTVK